MPRKKKVVAKKVVEEPKVQSTSKVKLTIEDVCEFLKKNPQYLIKEPYYGRYSLFLDNDFNLKK